MRSTVAGFVVGIILLQQQANLLAWPYLMVLMAVAVFLFWMAKRTIRPWLVAGLCAGGAVLSGWCWASLLGSVALMQQLEPALEERELVVVGVVSSLPAEVDYGQRFKFAVEQVLTPGVDAHQLPAKIMLTFGAPAGSPFAQPGSSPADEALQQPALVQPGERWQFKVRLRRPHGLANPKGFDYEAWMLEQRLGASGSVRNSPLNTRIDPFVFSINNVVQRCRGILRQRIMRRLEGRTYAPIIVALVIGDQNGISQDDWQIFSRTGVNHLVAISGLHISMMAGLMAGLMAFLWRRGLLVRYGLPLYCPVQKVAALAGLLAAVLYVALAGFGVPAQRALIMIAVCAASVWANRTIARVDVLMLALGLVVMIDPWAVLWPGFWLSFCAVGLIFYATGGRTVPKVNRRPDEQKTANWFVGLGNAMRQALRVQNAITIGLIPVTLLMFYQISLVGPIANAVAIPAVSWVVMPLAMLGSVAPEPLASLLCQGSHAVLEWLIEVLQWLAQSPWATWRAPRPELWMAVCAAAGAAWCLAPRGWPMRWAGLLTWLPVIVNSSNHPAQAQFRVTALDVGQGMALLIETATHRLLYDTGPAFGQRADAGSRVIYPYLTMRGIGRLDGLMISHNDVDHSGGALTLMRQLDIDWVSSSLKPESPVVIMAQQRSRHLACLAGQHWIWDDIEFTVLHPSESVYVSSKWKPNARSCTLLISNGTLSMLLPGDIEAVQEDELINTIPDQLPATVLLAPHHGSGTSSTRAFLRAVQPQLAVFQLGYHNRYRHPKPEVWERYAEFGIARLRSDWAGAITLDFSEHLHVEATRRTDRRYWSSMPLSDSMDVNL